MKVSFIHFTDAHDLNAYPPLAFGYLKAYAEKHGFHGIEWKFLSDWKSVAPDTDLVGITALSQDFSLAAQACNKLAEQGLLVVIGGIHISECSHELPESAAAGIIGEGEATFLELLQCLAETGGLSPEHLTDIPGLVFYDKTNLIKTTERQPLPTEDILIPDRTLPPPNSTTLHIITARGCPFNCSFCSSSRFWKQLRTIPVPQVLDEVKYLLQEFPKTTRLTIVDDLFVAIRPRFREFVKGFLDSGFRKRLKINTTIRADLVDRELCELLRDLQVEFVYFGLESASEHIQKKLKSPFISLDQIRSALDMLHSYGITVHCTFIIGVPGETQDDLETTYSFIAEMTALGKIGDAIANVLTPFPGTQVWDDACKSGNVTMPFDWSLLRHYAYLGDNHEDSLSVDEWVENRKQSNSVYLNHATLPEGSFYLIVKKWETRLKSIRSSMKK